MLSTRKRDNHFSEEIWSDVALHYQVSIEALSQESWDLIIDGTWQIAQDKPAGRASSSRLPGGAQLPEVNERQLLVEDSDPISGDEDDMEWDEVPPLSRQESVEVCEYFDSHFSFQVSIVTNIVYYPGYSRVGTKCFH